MMGRGTATKEEGGRGGTPLLRSGGGVVDLGGGFVSGCGSGLVSGLGGRLVGSRGGVSSGFVSLIFGVAGLTFVPHIGNITVGISLVGNNLHTAIGQVDTVFSSGIVVVTALLLAESSSRVRILHSVFVVVHGGKNGVFVVWGGGGVVRGRVIGKGRGGGESQDSGG